jgi:hypothetical protein
VAHVVFEADGRDRRTVLVADIAVGTPRVAAVMDYRAAAHAGIVHTLANLAPAAAARILATLVADSLIVVAPVVGDRTADTPAGEVCPVAIVDI